MCIFLWCKAYEASCPLIPRNPAPTMDVATNWWTGHLTMDEWHTLGVAPFLVIVTTPQGLFLF